MKHVIISLLLVLVVISSSCIQTAYASTTLDISKIDSQIDKYFKASRTVGGSLVIAKDGQIVYSRDFQRSRTPI